jgi:hypothetical protein
MTTGELIAELAAAVEGSDWWRQLCHEAHWRVRLGSLSPRHVPASYDPGTWLLPGFSELEAS